nr:papilin isoform X2 [Parasteatoda tepidariorum]
MKILFLLCITSIAFGDSNNTIQQARKPDLCNLPVDSGICRALHYRFAFNQTSGHCEEFVYGGCGGNANNFFIQEICEVTCGDSQTTIPKSCSGAGETGSCKAYSVAWFYDSDTETCKRFIYGGCGGNGNIYETEIECLQECKENLNYSKECPENSKFVLCGTACPLTCDNFRNPPTECNRICYSGCECDEGYVRAENGSCILPENCPFSFLPNGPRENCPANSHFNPCGTDCPLTCENYRNPPDICNLMCRIGCECDNGYVSTSDGSCILPENCALQNCPANSVFSSCGSSCPLTCENYSRPPESCTTMCKIGCECLSGYVLTEDGRCVLPVDCPVKTCPPHSQFNSCGTFCPVTCENFRTPPEFCIQVCKTGCECESGYVLEEDGNCVLPENCANDNTTDFCRQPRKVGPCRALVPRFYYNQRTKRCQQFYYGGCQGNDNNFKSLEDCDSTCIEAPQLPFACQQDREIGTCDQSFPRFFYNRTSAQCQDFIYRGCEGNDNNFQSLEDCEAVCQIAQVESNMI